MDQSASPTVKRSLNIKLDCLEAKRFLLSPTDALFSHRITTISYPFFFNYDINGDRFLDAWKALLVKYPIFCGRIQPDDDTRFVDPSRDIHSTFTELTCEISIAQAIYDHTRFKTEGSDSLVNPVAPFFMELNNSDELLKGNEPLIKARLTHFSDGCCISVTVPHMLTDAHRYLELMRDISRAYRGEEIPDRDHDRSYLWPDRYAAYFDLGDEVAKLPRKIPVEPSSSSAFPGFPGDTCENHALHFSQDVLDAMKEKVKPYLAEGEYVSSNDVLSAFFWMLESELNAKQHPIDNESDLDINNTMAIAAFEMLANGIEAIPKNYSGNAIFTFPLINLETEDAGSSISEVFAKLAKISRSATVTVKQQPLIAGQALLVYYNLISGNQVDSPLPSDRIRVMMTNHIKLPVDDIDFEGGGPVYSCMLPFPCTAAMRPLGPGHKLGGAVIQTLLGGQQIPIFEKSVIVKELAPGMKNLFTDLSLDELKSKLGCKQ